MDKEEQTNHSTAMNFHMVLSVSLPRSLTVTSFLKVRDVGAEWNAIWAENGHDVKLKNRRRETRW